MEVCRDLHKGKQILFAKNVNTLVMGAQKNHLIESTMHVRLMPSCSATVKDMVHVLKFQTLVA